MPHSALSKHKGRRYRKSDGKEKFLKATENGLRKIREKAMQASGGPTGFTEYLAPVSSIAETEYCSFAFFNSAYAAMSAITGEAKYGDYMELPPEEDRKCKKHAILVDTERNYTEYAHYRDGMKFDILTRSIR